MAPAAEEDGNGHGTAGVRYLHLNATVGELLPEDLTPLLVPGTEVIRRDGRVAALLAPAPSDWEEQVRRLETQRYSVVVEEDCA